MTSRHRGIPNGNFSPTVERPSSLPPPPPLSFPLAVAVLLNCFISLFPQGAYYPPHEFSALPACTRRLIEPAWWGQGHGKVFDRDDRRRCAQETLDRSCFFRAEDARASLSLFLSFPFSLSLFPFFSLDFFSSLLLSLSPLVVEFIFRATRERAKSGVFASPVIDTIQKVHRHHPVVDASYEKSSRPCGAPHDPSIRRKSAQQL